MKYGAMQYLLGVQEPLFETARAMGLDGVELGYGEDNDLTTVPAKRAVTKGFAAAAGVLVPSLCIGCLNRGGLSSDDATVHDRALELIHGSLDAAVELGATVILVPFFFKAAPHTEVELQRVVDGLRAVAPEAERRGLTLAYEGELPAASMIELLDRIDSPAVKDYYDVGNAVWLGFDPLAEIRQLGDRIAQVHFKEFDQKLNACPLGEGQVPVAEACDALREIGYDGWVVLETGTFGDALTNTKKQFDYLHQFI